MIRGDKSCCSDDYVAADLEDEYRLTEAQQESFRLNGHIYLQAVASGRMLSVFRPRLLRAIADIMGTFPQEKYTRTDFGGDFTQMLNLWTYDVQLKRFLFARRFARLAAKLMNAGSVRYHYDSVLFKNAGAGATPWHQDQIAWPLDTHQTITLWMPIVNLTERSGLLSYASGSHVSGRQGLKDMVRSGLEIVSLEEMRAGDATFHYGWTYHNAGSNQTSQTREAISILYYADPTRIMPWANDSAGHAHAASFFPGLRPGDNAEGELHPIVYP